MGLESCLGWRLGGGGGAPIGPRCGLKVGHCVLEYRAGWPGGCQPGGCREYGSIGEDVKVDCVELGSVSSGGGDDGMGWNWETFGV